MYFTPLEEVALVQIKQYIPQTSEGHALLSISMYALQIILV